MTDYDHRQYIDNLRLAQAKIHEGDAKWYVVNASGYVVKGPWVHKPEAEGALKVLQGRYHWEEDENPNYGPGNPDWERDFVKTTEDE